MNTQTRDEESLMEVTRWEKKKSPCVRDSIKRGWKYVFK